MPRTTTVNNHGHDYKDIDGRQVTSMDGESPHLHVVPPFPATETSISNRHSHGVPGRTSDAEAQAEGEVKEETQEEEA